MSHSPDCLNPAKVTKRNNEPLAGLPAPLQSRKTQQWAGRRTVAPPPKSQNATMSHPSDCR